MRAGDLETAVEELEAMTAWSREDAVMVASSHVARAAARLGNQPVLEWLFNFFQKVW
jgi:hypothetical protein